MCPLNTGPDDYITQQHQTSRTSTNSHTALETTPAPLAWPDSDRVSRYGDVGQPRQLLLRINLGTWMWTLSWASKPNVYTLSSSSRGSVLLLSAGQGLLVTH